ncbi:MAG: aldehyde dehydrogenase family protein [Candidatus Bipolaricaulia bacterium]
MHMKEYGLYIGGEWLTTREQFKVENPANQEIIARCALAGQEEVDRAVEAARRAFPDWSERSFDERGELLAAVAAGLKERLEELAELEAMETGRCLKETLAHDLPATANLFRYFAGVAGATFGETIPVPGEYLNYTRREPVGVVVGITPWNFPLWLGAIKIAPALAAGNTVIMKPASLTPLTTLELARIMEEAGLPPGVFNVITGPGARTGQLLAAHPGVDKVAFTGETITGTKIMEGAARNITRVSLELGGKSPNIVFADCDFDKAVAFTLLSIFFAQGQMCTAGSRLLVERAIHERFVAALVERASRLRIGDPLDPSTEFGPLASQAQLEKVEQYVARAKEEGAKLLLGGKRPEGAEFKRGYYFEPTIFDNVKNSQTIARKEIFGPVLAVIEFTDEEEAIALANDTDYGLAAGIWTQDLAKAHRVAHRVRAGKIWINCYNIFPPGAPFGGFKKSGFGREMGLHSLLELYTEVKDIQVDLGREYFDWFI